MRALKSVTFLSAKVLHGRGYRSWKLVPTDCLVAQPVRNFNSDDMSPPQGKTMEVVHKVRERMKEEGSSWDDLWKDGLTPWDLAGPTPVLLKELQRSPLRLPLDQESLFTLVPGCGSGYDIKTLVEHHERLLKDNSQIKESAVIGLDISPTSLERAADICKKVNRERTRIELMCGDFFQNDWKMVYSSHLEHESSAHCGDSSNKFDFIFDYTFFCALQPSLRLAWGERMAQLLKPDTGRLLTIIFPILPDEDRDKGPPFPVAIQDYRASLGPVGIVAESEPFESPLSVPTSRQGKELLCYWKKLQPTARL